MANELEQWKLIEEFPNYEVSNLGNVRNITTRKILKAGKTKEGYRHVVLCKRISRKTVKVARLTAIYFVDNPNKLSDVNHLNKKRDDDRADNLEWTSRRENMCYAKKSEKNKSQYTGVTRSGNKSKWRSLIYFKGKLLSLGTFETEIEAYSARVNFENTNNIKNKYL